MVLQGTSLLRFSSDGHFIKNISVDLAKPTAFMYYEPQGSMSGQYAVVDQATKKMYIWSIDENTAALTKSGAKKTLSMPDKSTDKRQVKGYDPVSKTFFIMHIGV